MADILLKTFTQKPNAGDKVSLRVAEAFLDGPIIPMGPEKLDRPNIILLGSILQWTDTHSHVCGAGLLAEGLPVPHPPASISCVRGPLTRDELLKKGIPCPEIYADPGVLAPDLFPEDVAQTTDIGIIPHYVDRHAPWLSKAHAEGAEIISVTQDLESYFAQLKACKIILSSTLHGIIFAHAFGIPALWIELSDKVMGDGFKFRDYYASCDESETRVRINGTERLSDLILDVTCADLTNMRGVYLQALKDTQAQITPV